MWVPAKDTAPAVSISTSDAMLHADGGGLGVFRDTHETNPALRFKISGGSPAGCYDATGSKDCIVGTAGSPDGLHQWTVIQKLAFPPPWRPDCHTNAFWDEPTGQYLMTTRDYLTKPPKMPTTRAYHVSGALMSTAVVFNASEHGAPCSQGCGGQGLCQVCGTGSSSWSCSQCCPGSRRVPIKWSGGVGYYCVWEGDNDGPAQLTKMPRPADKNAPLQLFWTGKPGPGRAIAIGASDGGKFEFTKAPSLVE
eukprot:COSAG01_NODE_773_length_13704_cov_9.386843_5_plen_251_part_00